MYNNRSIRDLTYLKVPVEHKPETADIEGEWVIIEFTVCGVIWGIDTTNPREMARKAPLSGLQHHCGVKVKKCICELTFFSETNAVVVIRIDPEMVD